MIKHLACIMDGNRRWARKQGWQAIYGHRQGIETIKRVVEFSIQKNISYLSLYTFSIENLQRSQEEKSSLFSLMFKEASSILEELLKLNVRIHFIGDNTLFPTQLKPVCAMLEEKTKECTGLQLHFLFCYGGRQEIVGSVKTIISQLKLGLIKEEDVNESLIAQHLWLSHVPAPDLIIRTGGFKRLSNFLLFQAAYSDLYFLDCLWPELTMDDLEKAYDDFSTGQRNFGT